jgi:hypothetical protein
MAEQTPPQASAEIRRATDLVSMYANNVHFELSIWDLKFIFGELQQHEGKEIIEQRLSVTIPWLQVKIMSLFLQLHVAFYEAWQGKINVPPNFLPQRPPPDQAMANDPNASAITEVLRKKIDQLLADI